MIFACVPDIDSAHISYGIRAAGTYRAGTEKVEIADKTSALRQVQPDTFNEPELTEGAIIMTSASIAGDSSIQVSDAVDITKGANDTAVIKGAADYARAIAGLTDKGISRAEAAPDDEELRLVMKEVYNDLRDMTDKAGDEKNADGSSAERADTHGDSYTVVQGDCLWNIAKAQYGSGIDYIKIYEANRDVIGDDPNLIFPGTELVLP